MAVATDSFLALSDAPGVLQAARPARTAAEALPRTNPLRVKLSFMFFPSSLAPVRGETVCPQAESEMPDTVRPP